MGRVEAVYPFFEGSEDSLFPGFPVPVYVFSKGGNTVFMDVLKPVGNQLEKVTIPIPLE